jgi:hypothetical protein
MSQPNPRYADGLQAVTDLVAYCYNNAVTYMCYDGDPSEDGVQKLWTDSNEEPLGSDNRTGFRVGTLNLQYTLAADELQSSATQMRPAYVILFRNRFYVTGKVTNKVVKNDVIKFSVAVTELQNPFISALVSTLGQLKRANINANIAATLSCAANVMRSGGSVTYAVTQYNTGDAISGVSIASNGLLTINVAAGALDLRVTATDTLSGEPTMVGFGRYQPTAV